MASSCARLLKVIKQSGGYHVVVKLTGISCQGDCYCSFECPSWLPSD